MRQAHNTGTHLNLNMPACQLQPATGGGGQRPERPAQLCLEPLPTGIRPAFMRRLWTVGCKAANEPASGECSERFMFAMRLLLNVVMCWPWRWGGPPQQVWGRLEEWRDHAGVQWSRGEIYRCLGR